MTQRNEPVLYPSYIAGLALTEFDDLDEPAQRCLDESFSALELEPRPSDAVDLGGGLYAVYRCGFWIGYEPHDDTHELEIWRVVP